MIYLPAIDESDPVFPPVQHALEDPDGLLAIGGRLNTLTLLRAYRQGIFPWFEEQQPVLWWCPSQRAVLIPGQEHVGKSLAKLMRKGVHEITTNRCFSDVISGCAAPRSGSAGTWITSGMQEAYQELHEQGYAHSVECWREEHLVGGLYGVQVGSVFCGESMFSREDNGSKLAFTALSRILAREKFRLIDCQLENPHLTTLGVKMISRDSFLQKLAIGVGEDINWPDSDSFQQTLKQGLE